MNGGFRQSMAWLHTWVGLAFGWILFAVVLTGALSVFQHEITQWMRAPPSAFWQDLWGAAPGEPRPSYRLTQGGHHFVRLHFSLHGGDLGIWAVGLATLALLTAVVTGVVTHVRLFRDLFTFRPGKGARSWLDAHVALGVATLPFVVMIAYTGLVLMYATYLPIPHMLRHRAEAFSEKALYGEVRAAEPGPVDAASLIALTSHPPIYETPEGREESRARSARQTFVALHMVYFGGAVVRWAYFASALAAAAAIATGLVLYAAKRKRRHLEAIAPGLNIRLVGAVERLNCSAVAGLCTASAAYFWINRLLPLGLGDRSNREVLLFAACWVGCLIHACLRPPRAAWREQFAAAAVLCCGMPLLNALTSDASLLATASAGEWRLAAVDLTAIAAGGLFAALALRLRVGGGAADRPARRGLEVAPDAA